MVVSSLIIENIRNHELSNFQFNPNFNLIFGENGIGKTSILEAISYCSLGKSFTGGSDSSILKMATQKFNIKLNSKYDDGLNYEVRVKYDCNTKKQITNTYSDNCLAKDLISNFPLVVLSPDLKEITVGAPQYRRNFIDKVISYCNISYFQALSDYKRVLKQRNNLLSLGQKERHFDYSELELWDKKQLELSVKITFERLVFLEKFRPIFDKYYLEISNKKEEVEINYKFNNDLDTQFNFSLELSDNLHQEEKKKQVTDNLLHSYQKLLDKIKPVERYRGVSLIGPHKDDLDFFIEKRLVKETASQGQHKTFLIALKFAELDYIAKYRKENPIVLLDDIFSELDESRSKQLIQVLSQNQSQVFITLTETNKLSFLNQMGLNTTLFSLPANKNNYKTVD